MMKSLWRRRRARVREVRSDLQPDRKLAYTTVMTVLDRLFRKGIVTRTRESRAHVYEPAVSEARVRADAVGGLLEDFFSGSKAALRTYLENGEAGSERVTLPPPGPPAAPEPKSREEHRPIDESLL